MAGLSSTDLKNFNKNVTKYITHSMGMDGLQRLLNHKENWEIFVEEAVLSRDEAQKLKDYLKKHTRNSKMVNLKSVPEDIPSREKFLEIFPKVEAEIKSCIQQLNDLAREIDEVHKGCTISSVVTSSVGAISGVMSIAGLALAPVTGGASLAISAAGAGLGPVSAVSSAGTTIVERLNTRSAKDKAESILSISEGRVRKLLGDLFKIAPDIFKKCFELDNIRNMARNIRAHRKTLINSSLAEDAIRLITTGGISVESAGQLGKAVGGTAFSVSSVARITGTVLSGFFLGLDVYNIVNDSKHLREGAKAALAEELRRKAQKLEEGLKEFYQIYSSL